MDTSLGCCESYRDTLFYLEIKLLLICLRGLNLLEINVFSCGFFSGKLSFIFAQRSHMLNNLLGVKVVEVYKLSRLDSGLFLNVRYIAETLVNG